MTVPVPSPLILLVEDFADTREMYSDYLTFSGFRVATATNGQEAVEQARTLEPDLILMDLSLPGIDGWEATRILKADPATSSTSRSSPSARTRSRPMAKALARLAATGSLPSRASRPISWPTSRAT